MVQHEQWALLSAFLDGELRPAERAGVESHLAACSTCRSEFAALGAAKKLAASAPRRVLPADLLARLEKRLLRPGWLELPALHLPRGLVPAGALAGALLILGLWAARQASTESEYMYLEPLIAAHSRYAAEGLVPQEHLAQPNFSAELVAYHGE